MTSSRRLAGGSYFLCNAKPQGSHVVAESLRRVAERLSSTQAGGQAPVVVAVVDDDPSVRRAVARMLRAEGFAVRLYDSGEAYLAADPRDARPDFAIVDINLGGLTGPDVKLELDRRGDHTPLVYMTAHEESSTAELLKSTPGILCLRKPFAGTRLLDLIRKALP
jgi:FixJ family two-component response regulator